MDEENEYELELKSEDICRACLQQSPDLKNIFSGQIVDGKIIAFPKIYENVIDKKIEKNSKFPNQVCVPCKTKIIEFYTFKQKCKQSEELLQSIFGRENEAKPSTSTSNTEEISSSFLSEKDVITESVNEEINLPEETNTSRKTKIKDEKEIDIIPCDEENTEYLENLDDLNTSETEIIETYEYLETTSNTNTDDMMDQTNIFMECAECDLIFEDLTSIEEHQKQHHMKKTNKSLLVKSCKFCKIQFKKKSEDYYAEHFKTHKKTFTFLMELMDLFKCSQCNKVYCNSTNYDEHLLNEHNDTTETFEKNESNKCLDLNNELKDMECKNNFIIYDKKMLDENNFIYTCKSCNVYETESESNLNEHIQECYNEEKYQNDSIYICSVCSNWTDNKAEIFIHLYFHSSSFVCPFNECAYEYSTFRKLNTHLDKHHLYLNIPSCKHCKKSFDTYDELYNHLKKDCHMRYFSCSYCEKPFLSSRSKMLHERIHTADKRYVCSICGKAFIQSGDLQIHLRIHTGEKPFKCPICPKTFRTYGNRQDHVTSHSQERNYKCEVCNKSFKAFRILKGHMKLHTGERNFNCPECGKLFSRNQHVISHMRVHQKQKLNLVSANENENSDSKDKMDNITEI